MLQFLRKARVTFAGPGGFVVNPGLLMKHQLRVTFEVTKGVSSKANTFKIKIYNLNESHRNSIGQELDTVKLEVGYTPPDGTTNIGIIAQGKIRDYQHDRDGPDIITTVSCGDGDKAFRNATISKTIPKGTPLKDVVNDLHMEMRKQGIKKGEWEFPEKFKEEKTKRPYSMCGSCTQELDTLGRGHGFYWNIQNETMEIIPGDGALPGMILISPETGMIGTPTITDNGIKVKALINPDARPNRQVKVDSEQLRMNKKAEKYRISEISFSGDNQEGSDWTMMITGEAIGADKKVNEGKTKATTTPQDEEKLKEALDKATKAAAKDDEQLQAALDKATAAAAAEG